MATITNLNCKHEPTMWDDLPAEEVAHLRDVLGEDTLDLEMHCWPNTNQYVGHHVDTDQEVYRLVCIPHEMRAAVAADGIAARTSAYWFARLHPAAHSG